MVKDLQQIIQALIINKWIKRLVLFFIALTVTSSCIGMAKKGSMKVFVPLLPYSTDPLDSDSLPNHLLIQSVYGQLVSLGSSAGEVTSLIAKSWKVNEDFTEWSFKIHSDLKFGNGELISCIDVVNSLKRVALIQKNTHSKSGLFEYLVSLDELNDLKSIFSGIRCEEDVVKLTFVIPVKDVLIKLSQGLYSIVHKNLYHDVTGIWKDKKKIISSNSYDVETWDVENVKLVLRNFKRHGHEKKAKEIVLRKFVLGEEFDIAFLDNRYKGDVGEDYKFKGGPVTGIQYLELRSWQDPKSFFFDKENRKLFRDAVYNTLIDMNIKPSYQFIPTEKVKKSEIRNTTPLKLNKKVKIVDPTKLFSFSPSMSNLFDRIFRFTFKSLELEFEYIDVGFKTLLEEKRNTFSSVDIAFFTTSLFAATPYPDVKFMFNSKEGVMLPDPTGKARSLTKDDVFDLDLVNEVIQSDCIIIPLYHFTPGYFYSSNLDMNYYSNKISAIDFNWIGYE